MRYIVAVDVGNTNITVGTYDQEGNIGLVFRLESDVNKTEDEFFITLKMMFESGGLDHRQIFGFCLSSVVPPIQDTLEAMIMKYFPKSKLVILGPGVKTSIPIRYNTPADVGADRIANAVGAWEKYGKKMKQNKKIPIVVVDFGTAVTFDCISPKGEYLGGAIFPGIWLALESLFKRTAKLPRVQLKDPGEVIGKNTIHSIQSGIVYGYASMIDGMIERISDEFRSEVLAIATGGYAEMIFPHTRRLKTVDKTLTLDGLYYVFIKNTEKIERTC